MPPSPTSATQEPRKFADFGSWFKQIGEKQARRGAHHVSGFDADIIEMRLPLATKVRMQRERNYQREIKEHREWFADTISLKGFVEWWS
jgi:hypothetical protein